MPEHKRKRSRSLSKDDHRHKHIREKKFNDMQKQLDNLTKVVEALVHVQKEQKPANQSTEIETDDTEIFDVEENKENNPNSKKDSNTEVIDRCIQQNQRLQTLALINIENISISNSGISIKITEQIKTSKPGGFQPELILPFYKDKPCLCVASTVLDYIDFTKDLRSQNTKNLLIATMKPFGAISAQTIGHWIKTLLGKAGINVKQFTAYSTRHAAVSTAHKRGVDIDTIRRSARWAPGSQTFFKFCNRPIQAPNDQFARAILH